MAITPLVIEPIKPTDELHDPSANRNTNNKRATAPNLRTVAIDLRLIAKKGDGYLTG